MKKFLENLKATFSLDEKSLALVRVFFGLVLFFDSITRWIYLEDFFGVNGIISRNHFLTSIQNAWNWSIFAIAPSDLILHGLYAILVFLTILFTLGYRHRLTTFALWFFLCSLQNRNWYINNSGDDLQRVALFMMLFLPMTKFYSIDNALNRIKSNHKSYFSIWSFIYILQISIVYIISYYLKTGEDWHKSFKAMQYAFQLEYFTLPSAKFLLNFPSLLKFLTKVTMLMEGFLPYLLLLPLIFRKSLAYVRYIVVITFVGFHLTLIFTYKIGAFPWTCIAIWLGLLPREFWQIFSRNNNVNENTQSTIYYDGECGFCKKGVFLVKQFFILRNVNILKAQSDANVFNLMTKQNSWVIQSDNKYYFRYEAFLKLMSSNSQFSFLTPILKLIFPIGDLVYQIVSRNRKFASKSTVFLKWQEINMDAKWGGFKIPGFVVGVLYFSCVGSWCLGQTGYRKLYSPKVAKITQYMNWYQNWGMFAPNVRKDYGWISIEATAKNGKKWDLFLDKPYDGIQPECISCSYKSKEWRKYFLNYTRSDKLRQQFGIYQCKKWNSYRSRPLNSQLKEFKVKFHSRSVLSKDKAFNTRVLWHHFCYSQDLKAHKEHQRKTAPKTILDKKQK